MASSGRIHVLCCQGLSDVPTICSGAKLKPQGVQPYTQPYTSETKGSKRFREKVYGCVWSRGISKPVGHTLYVPNSITIHNRTSIHHITDSGDYVRFTG